jgi:DNA-binding NarL/FixJ family response regulator
VSAGEKVRLALCDDAYAFVKLLRLLFSIEPDIEVVGDAGNGNEAVELCARTRPDVLLLDVAMPERDGVDALPDILEASPATKVLVYTGFASREVERTALARGAREVLLKGTAPADLLARIRAVHAGT